MFAFQHTHRDVDVAFTDRHGGISGGPYASLNLAVARATDSPQRRAEVAHNVDRAVRGFTGTADATPTPRLVSMSQVHGADVAVVGSETQHDPPVADGLVTDVAGTVLMVRVADCVPLLLADVDHGVVGAAHAGRPGLVAGIVPRTVEAMRGLGADRVVAWVGPHVCGRCYEVPSPMRADVCAVVPEAYAETSWGTPAVDIGAGVRAQLVAAGVEVVDAGRCTLEHDDLFSYRRQGPESGRMAGLVWRRP